MHPKVTATEIAFNVPSASDFYDYACWVARIIDYAGKLIPKEGGYAFMIGTSNDWWIGYGYKPGEMIVARRYGDKEFMGKLREVLIKVMDLERFNPEEPEADPAAD